MNSIEPERFKSAACAQGLGVATGIIRGKTTKTKKQAGFQACREEAIADQPAEWKIHVVRGNLSAPKWNDVWLAAHPNVIFHFTP